MAEPRRSAYVNAGVDVEAGAQAVELMQAAVESTRRPEVIGGLGGFGGAVTIPAGYREPVIVSSTDGVGTKTAIASALGRFDTVGIDLVAMCADDVVCAGAEPLFFLDYLAVGRLDPPQAAELVEGVAAGCRMAGCALVGGETAEHPGLMDPSAFDLAGCCVGIVERDRLIDGTAAEAGDSIIGLAASGLHSNGFSLVRSLVAQWGLDLARPYQEQLHLTLGTSDAAEAMRAEPEHGLATLGEVLLAPTRIYARALLGLRESLIAAGHDLRGLAHITGGGLPGNAHRALPGHLGARVDPSTWRTPSVMRLMSALGGLDDAEMRATFNGGLGMVVVVPPAAVAATVQRLAQDDIVATVVGEVVSVEELGGQRYAEGRLGVSGRIAVGVSGAGSNLRALHAAASRHELGGEIALVFADRPCAALDWAAEQGIDTALVPGGDDEGLAAVLAGARPDAIVLAGYMRIVGPLVLAAHAGTILNTHPSLLPAFPGAHAVRDAIAHGATVTGATVHLVDATLDGGPIVAQEAVQILPGDDETSLHERIRAVEHRILPRATALLLADAVSIAPDGRRVRIDLDRAEASLPVPRRALLSVSDKTGLADFGRGLVGQGFELVSTGGTARALRDAGLPVTDVAAVTGFPEMLDGRIKTLHPRVHAGLLADRRLADHRRQLIGAAIAPFELVVVNLYPFAAAAERPGIRFDELVEEIDIGGPSMVRAAAKNHASVAIVSSPARYELVLAAIEEEGSVPAGLRSALAIEAFRATAAYDARIAAELPQRMAEAGVALPDEAGLPGAGDPFPVTLTIALEKIETLRYGENPHQPAARYRRAGPGAGDGPFASTAGPLQGKQLSYNNVLDASAAAALARQFDGPACVIVKHTNPCGAAERGTLADAWTAALSGDPVSAFGGVVALTREVDRATAEGMASIFLEVIVAPGFDNEARAILAAKPNLRLVVDPSLGSTQGPPTPDPTGSVRTAGGAVLVTSPDTIRDDPAIWSVATSRAPTDAEQRDLELAWRLVRGATSNAIVLVRDGRLVGLGSGQTSRVDAARQAVEKAIAISGEAVLRGAACASDAFYPFPDGVDVCIAAGVTAFVQPGGSMRDDEVIAAAEGAGATMLLTGVRHFRH